MFSPPKFCSSHTISKLDAISLFHLLVFRYVLILIFRPDFKRKWNSKMPSSKPLFEASLISESVSSSLPAPYKIRPLERSDYAKGFLDCLRVLTHIGDISEERFNQRYDFMDIEHKGGYYVLVIEDDKERIVGTGVLVVERKL